MRLRFWPKRQAEEPGLEPEPALEPAPRAAEPSPPRPSGPPPRVPAPPPHPEPELAPPPVVEPAAEQAPARISLTIEEAKGVIREAGGDVIQVGFLASAYRRHLEDDPASAETAASRKRLHELVGKRLKDRGLLAPDGTVELRDGD